MPNNLLFCSFLANILAQLLSIHNIVVVVLISFESLHFYTKRFRQFQIKEIKVEYRTPRQFPRHLKQTLCFQAGTFAQREPARAMADLSFKYRKKAVRDIYLSSDIGRESPFDPFKDRTVTKFMANPNSFVSDGMYFAEKQGRRVPNMVKYDTVSHHANIRVDRLVEEGGIPATRREDEALNAKGYERPSYIRDVSFTKAPRFGVHDPESDNPIQRRKRLMEEREERLKMEKFLSSTRHDNSKMPDIVQTPDFSRAPAFGPPPPKDDSSILKGQSKFTVFEFEKKAGVSSSGALPSAAGGSRPPRSESAPLMGRDALADPLSDDSDGDGDGGLASEQTRLMTSAADAQEAWEAKRKATLAKHGMIVGSRRELLKAKALAKRADTAQGIADFSLLASREAPTGYQPRGKETNDLLYLPKYGVTTREAKRVADVRLDRYAGRAAKSTAIKDSVDKLLTIENLSKFYKARAEAERQSAFITPDEQAAFARAREGSVGEEASASASRVSRHHQHNNNSSALSAIDPLGPIKPFSPFDDFSLHPPTPPKGTQTRKFTKTPDLAVFADRANEPLSAILGGNRGEREKKARQALRREGLL